MQWKSKGLGMTEISGPNKLVSLSLCWQDLYNAEKCYGMLPLQKCERNERQLNKWAWRQVQAQVTICLPTSAGTLQPSRAVILNTSVACAHPHTHTQLHNMAPVQEDEMENEVRWKMGRSRWMKNKDRESTKRQNADGNVLNCTRRQLRFIHSTWPMRTIRASMSTKCL